MTQDFEQFWSAYPKKQAKAEARKVWQQKKSVLPSIELLLTAIQDQCASDQWQRDGGQYIPQPARWLRGERWDDVIEVKLPTTRRPDKYDLANLEFNERYGVKA